MLELETPDGRQDQNALRNEKLGKSQWYITCAHVGSHSITKSGVCVIIIGSLLLSQMQLCCCISRFQGSDQLQIENMKGEKKANCASTRYLQTFLTIVPYAGQHSHYLHSTVIVSGVIEHWDYLKSTGGDGWTLSLCKDDTWESLDFRATGGVGQCPWEAGSSHIKSTPKSGDF